MRLIKSLCVEDRASLLHNLHPEEIASLVAFSIEAAEGILSRDGNRTPVSVNLLHSTPFWYNLVARAKTLIEDSRSLLIADSAQFGRQLFEGKNFLFAFYCLHHYIVEGRCHNKTFITAAEQLFFYC